MSTHHAYFTLFRRSQPVQLLAYTDIQKQICVCLPTYTLSCMFMYTYIQIQICVCIYTYSHILCIHTYKYKYVCIYMQYSTCAYICIYICTHTYKLSLISCVYIHTKWFGHLAVSDGVKPNLPHDPAIPVLGTYPRGTKHMFPQKRLQWLHP